MKKVVSLLFLILSFFCVSGQIVLSRHTLNLKKSAEEHQFLNAVNQKTQEVLVFASDPQQLIVQKYNRALFFSDSLVTSKPDDTYQNLMGYSFDAHNNPDVYLVSENFKQIAAVHFDFENRSNTTQTFDLPLPDQTVIGSFSEQNNFYLLSFDEQQKLHCYTFINGSVRDNTIDFSRFTFVNSSGKEVKFSNLLTQNPPEKIQTNSLVPLYYGTKKIKYYVTGDKMVLTLDHNSAETQLFEIDLTDFSVVEKKFAYPALSNDVRVNSYFNDNKLFQLKLNETELILTAKTMAGEILHTYSAKATDSIAFKNSPLYTQTGNQRAFPLKTTKKFLRRLSMSNVGLSVYKTPDEFMVTVGGSRDVASTDEILLGVTAGVGVALSGGGDIGFMADFFDRDNLQTTYFEGLFDENFTYKDLEQQRLASDYVSEFYGKNQAFEAADLFPYRNYYILGYYDPKAKEYVLRKFRDDGAQD